MKDIKEGQTVFSYFLNERGISINETLVVREEDGYGTVRLKYKNSTQTYIENVKKVFPTFEECLDHIKEIMKKLQDDCNALAYQSAGEAKHA